MTILEWDYEKIAKLGGIQWPCNDEYPEGKKRLYTEGFHCKTSDGKAKLLPVDWMPLSEKYDANFPMNLNTGRTVRAMAHTHQNQDHCPTQRLKPLKLG